MPQGFFIVTMTVIPKPSVWGSQGADVEAPLPLRPDHKSTNAHFYERTSHKGDLLLEGACFFQKKFNENLYTCHFY